MNPIDVIIPIYNAFEDVVTCIDSVRRNLASNCRLVLIDDCSSDERIAGFFAKLEAESDPRIVLLKNSSNLGFVGTVNRGMSLSSNDVVLLNSDTIVTVRWLEKLNRCAVSDPTIGTITPFSNNAEICSFPLFCQNNSLDGVNIEVVNRAMEKAAAPVYPDIPTAVGFCMYIRRTLLDKIGIFDAETFGLGYGEENDFCMRARHAGYRNVLCDDTFVAHIGNRSFDAKTETLKARNMLRLLEKHPDYQNIVQCFIAADPIAPIRAAASARLARAALQNHVRVASITVAFNPDPIRLAAQVAALRNQVDEIIIVDNGSMPTVESILRQFKITARIGDASRINVIALFENTGIASGFNTGVDTARQSDANFVLLLDHDSVPAMDMVEKLIDGYRRASDLLGANNVAAVGPRITDSRDAREYPFIRLGWFRNQRVHCEASREKLVAADFLISSGALIATSAIDRIGDFEAALFIDSVDLEWCCRARRGGLSLFGVCEARLDHQLGDQRLLVLKQINLVVHSPLRIYYMTRNRILLYRRSYVPLKWKARDLLRMTAKFVAIMLFVAPRLNYLRMTLLAVSDGLANRGGRLQERG